MKRIIVFAALVLITSTMHLWAITDGQVYETINGLSIVNQWVLDRVHSGTSYTNNAICNVRARTATMDQGIVYVARSEERMIIVGNDTVYQSVLHRFSASNGMELEDLPLTLDGVPYGRFLGVASVGKDSFHHIWVAPMTRKEEQLIPVYLVNTETGELTLVVEMDKGDALQRTDYLDVIGDLTLEKAECNIMTVSGSTSGPGFPTLYRVHADQHGKWRGGFDGKPYLDVTDFYPDTKTGFSLAPMIKMIEGQNDDVRYRGERFYIDCFDAVPVIYDLSGTIVDTFEDVDIELWPKTTPNGCMEFHLDGRVFLVYVIADMIGIGNGCQANICELVDGTLGEMTKYWKIPADSMGKTNDSGLRIHCFDVEYGTDEEGNEEVTLLSFKCFNGMAVYKIGTNVLGNGDYFDVGGISYLKTGNSTATVVGRMNGENYSGNIVIPSTVSYSGREYEVTAIDDRAFQGSYGLTDVTIPESVRYIGTDAFRNCGTLNSVVILGGLASIGDNAFKNTSVSTLYLGSSVTNIMNLGVNPSVIYSYSATPPQCDENSFTGYGATLHVPTTAIVAYYTASYWRNFANVRADAIEPQSVTISDDDIELETGATMSLDADVSPANARPNTVDWRSSNTEVATVVDGTVTAISPGECDIIASCLGKQAICHVVVTSRKVHITLDRHEVSVLPNHLVNMSVTCTPASTDLVVTSSDNAVAMPRIVNGEIQVLGQKEGTATITVSTADGWCIPDVCEVTVYTELGDVNCDGFINIADVVDLIDYLLVGDPSLIKLDNADIDGDGNVQIADVTDLIDYLLNGQ